MRRVLFSSATDEWNTPKSFYQALDAEFNFDFDPCPERSKFDGLSIEWKNCNFINPPYSNISNWIKKAYEESLKGKVCVMLIPSRTDTRYWHNYIMKAKEIRFIKGRLRFGDAKENAPFPSCIVIFNQTKQPSDG
jgi:hypothetical protein